jgi:hypothetical protein
MVAQLQEISHFLRKSSFPCSQELATIHSSKMRSDVNKAVQGEVLLLLPNLVPHPVSFNITVLVFTKKK